MNMLHLMLVSSTCSQLKKYTCFLFIGKVLAACIKDTVFFTSQSYFKSCLLILFSDDKLCPSSIHRYFCLKGFGCVHLTLSAKSHKYTNIKIPDLQHQDAEVYHQEELYDWLGGVANQILW